MLRKNSLVLLLVSIIFVNFANAQFKKWSSITTFNGGYANLVAEDTGNNLGGYAVDFSYLQTSLNGKYGAGIIISYINSQDEDTNKNRKINYSTFPIAAVGQYFFGSNTFQAYIQGHAGIQFSRSEYSGNNIYSFTGDAGLYLGTGIGSNIYLNDKILLNIAYNFSYISNGVYRDGVVHLFKIGIGFQSN